MSRRRIALTLLAEAALFLSIGLGGFVVARHYYAASGRLAGRAADIERAIQSFADDVRSSAAPTRESAFLRLENAARELRAAESALRGAPPR